MTSMTDGLGSKRFQKEIQTRNWSGWANEQYANSADLNLLMEFLYFTQWLEKACSAINRSDFYI